MELFKLNEGKTSIATPFNEHVGISVRISESGLHHHDRFALFYLSEGQKQDIHRQDIPPTCLGAILNQAIPSDSQLLPLCRIDNASLFFVGTSKFSGWSSYTNVTPNFCWDDGLLAGKDQNITLDVLEQKGPYRLFSDSNASGRYIIYLLSDRDRNCLYIMIMAHTRVVGRCRFSTSDRLTDRKIHYHFLIEDDFEPYGTGYHNFRRELVGT
jgi:hypothetical protein